MMNPGRWHIGPHQIAANFGPQEIPKYSGDQYNTGRKVPQSQAKRGDLLFWGPGGSQHVAIFLGGGKMLEASGSAGKVTVSPLRTAGLQPYLARMIES